MLDLETRRPVLFAMVTVAVLVGLPARAAEVLAKLGSTEVTVEEMRTYLSEIPEEKRAALEKNESLLARVVRTYLAQKVVLQEARAKGFEEDPKISARLSRIHDEALGDLYLDSVSRPPGGYPSDQEVEAAYKANRSLFVAPRRFRTSQIVLYVKDGADKALGKAADEKVRKRAQELVRKLRLKGADFALVARGASEERETAEKGGELGWLEDGQLPPPVLEALSAMKPGGVSEPLRLKDGWHVLKLDEVQAASVRPLPEVREAMVGQMRQAKAAELREAYVKKLVGDSEPALNELSLPKLLEEGK